MSLLPNGEVCLQSLRNEIPVPQRAVLVVYRIFPYSRTCNRFSKQDWHVVWQLEEWY